ncbi:ABC transporter substrate-binding protein, partial [Aquitalea sp. ASV11]|uniref:ABC transporter substrate-binding protein n=1 Tax=Aquitalea sp. ASV11 TaxID=2795103 RepID=UPI0018ECA279
SYDGRLVAGRGTAGDALIRAAGMVNAAADIQGFLPMNPEAWLKAAPDIVIVAAHNAPVYGGLKALQARPELASSNAVRSGKVLAWPAADFLRLGVGSPAVVARLRQLAS